MNKDKSKRLIPIEPDSNFRISWDMLGMLFIIYQTMMVPYRFCFKSIAKGNFYYFETAIDTFFIFDLCKSQINLMFLVLNFVTGYYKKGHVIMKRGVIIKHYLRTWFLIDFFASFPYSILFREK